MRTLILGTGCPSVRIGAISSIITRVASRSPGGYGGVARHFDVVLLRCTPRAAAIGDELFQQGFPHSGVGGKLVALSRDPHANLEIRAALNPEESETVPAGGTFWF